MQLTNSITAQPSVLRLSTHQGVGLSELLKRDPSQTRVLRRRLPFSHANPAEGALLSLHTRRMGHNGAV